MSRRTRAAAGIAGALALLAGAAASAPAATYEVTFSAEMSERWGYEEHADRDCAPQGRCIRDEEGHGSAHMSLRTPKPIRIEILRVPGGDPMIDAGAGEGIPVRGSSSRDGSIVEDYSGSWEAGNPDVVHPTEDCGTKPVRGHVSLAFVSRREVAVTTLIDDLRDPCPSGPPQFDWDEPGAAPSIGEVPALGRRAQVGRARQFTLRGARKWTGTVPAMNRTDPDDRLVRFGSVEVSWQWEAVFRRVGRR